MTAVARDEFEAVLGTGRGISASAHTTRDRARAQARAEGDPCVDVQDGVTMHFKDASHTELHREDGPAHTTVDGARNWFSNGQRHRTDGPAIETGDRVEYHVDGKLSRRDGPAITLYTPAGDIRREEWYLAGRRHRDRAPSIIDYSDPDQPVESWYEHGRLHRVDGPAISGGGEADVFAFHGQQLHPRAWRKAALAYTGISGLHDRRERARRKRIRQAYRAARRRS